MPAGTVQDDDRMGARRHGHGELVEHRLHGGGAYLGKNQGDATVAVRTDRAEQIDGLVAQVASAAGRTPFSNQRRQVRPILPILASSKNQTSRPRTSGCAALISAISAGKFF